MCDNKMSFEMDVETYEACVRSLIEGRSRYQEDESYYDALIELSVRDLFSLGVSPDSCVDHLLHSCSSLTIDEMISNHYDEFLEHVEEWNETEGKPKIDVEKYESGELNFNDIIQEDRCVDGLGALQAEAFLSWLAEDLDYYKYDFYNDIILTSY